MRSFLALILLVSVAGVALGNPTLEFPLLRQSVAIESTTTNTEISFMGSGYTKLIEELIQNLRKSAEQAREAVIKFTAGLQDEGKKSLESFEQGLQKLRDRISKAIEDLSNRFSASGQGVKQCITSHQEDASLLFNQTLQKTIACRDERFNEAMELIKGLTGIADNAQSIATTAFNEMKECTSKGGNFITVGSCLGALALKTEYNGAVFLTQSGMSIVRVNLFMATLPAVLEVCAGTSLVEAGIGTTKIVMEIGTCSASSVFNNFTGSKN